MGNKLVPILVGGVMIGLLSAIPFINWVNLCCCAWAIVGGGLAAMMYVRKSPETVSVGDAAMTGAMAGALGAIIYIVIFIPIAFLMGLPETYRRQFRQAYGSNLVDADVDGWLIIGLACVITFIMLIVMAGVGGLLGQKIFEKRTVGAEPPVPPSF